MKKILIVEGNLREENQSFSEAGIQTHTESLKDSLAYFTDKLETHVVNPSSDENIDKNIDSLESYDGLIWGGSSLNIYNNTPCLLYTSPSPRDRQKSRMPSSA